MRPHEQLSILICVPMRRHNGSPPTLGSAPLSWSTVAARNTPIFHKGRHNKQEATLEQPI